MLKRGGSVLRRRHIRVLGNDPGQKRDKSDGSELHHVPPREDVPDTGEAGEDGARLHADEVVGHEADEDGAEEGADGDAEDAAADVDGPVGRHGEDPQEEEEVGEAVRVLAQPQSEALHLDGHEGGDVLG